MTREMAGRPVTCGSRRVIPSLAIRAWIRERAVQGWIHGAMWRLRDALFGRLGDRTTRLTVARQTGHARTKAIYRAILCSLARTRSE